MKKFLSLLLIGSISLPLSAQDSDPEITLRQSNKVPIQPELSDLEALKGGASIERVNLLEYWETQMLSARESLLDMFLSPIKSKRLTKAPKDGCYYGIGNPDNSYEPYGLSKKQCIDCERQGGKLKANQSYVWGLTEGGGKIIWGTNNNYLCTANFDAIGGTAGAGMSMGLKKEENSCYVCEFESSEYGPNMSDWHAPRIYFYDIKKKKTTDITPSTNNTTLMRTLGLRSAGTLDNVSFIAGPDLDRNMSIFAFDNSDSKCKMIGSWTMKSLPGFESRKPYNIRRWVVAEGQLYFGVEWMDVTAKTSGGAILRWKKGVLDPNEKDPSKFFEVIGWTRGGTAELIYMNKRLYATTWPASTLCQSPEIPANKIFPALEKNNTTTWPELFSYAQYDPDPLMAQTGAGGAMAVYKDQLYFGTMHMPLVGMMMAPMIYKIDPNDSEAMLQTIIGTFRTAVLFRFTESTGKVELLYGEEELPAFDMVSRTWVKKPTGMKPLYGKSGFNNIMNNYIWSMQVMNDKLYIGSMDWTSTLLTRIEGMLKDKDYGVLAMKFLRGIANVTQMEGFDFVRIEGANKKAKLLSTNGLGIGVQYGIRNMTSVNNLLYLGTASPFNLHEKGGWELIEVAENKTYLGNLFKWAPARMQYGQQPGDNQYNAVVTTEEGTELAGKFEYTIMSEDVKDIAYLEPGNYNIRFKFTPENEDYDIVSELGTLEVGKKVLTVTADSVVLNIDDEIPSSFPYTISGFVLNDDKSVLNTLPVATADISGYPTEGTYTIHVAGGESNLYDFEYQPGVLQLRSPMGMNENGMKQLSLYPVPFRNEINIKSEHPVLKVVISNMAGSEVMNVLNPSSKLDLSSLDSGVYLMTVKTEHKTVTRKITKVD